MAIESFEKDTRPFVTCSTNQFEMGYFDQLKGGRLKKDPDDYLQALAGGISCSEEMPEGMQLVDDTPQDRERNGIVEDSREKIIKLVG